MLIAEVVYMPVAMAPNPVRKYVAIRCSGVVKRSGYQNVSEPSKSISRIAG